MFIYMEDLYPVITVQKYFEVIFVKNQAEYRNGENDITGLQKNIICLINDTKCFRVSKWLSSTFNKHGQLNVSAKQYMYW